MHSIEYGVIDFKEEQCSDCHREIKNETALMSLNSVSVYCKQCGAQRLENISREVEYLKKKLMGD